MTHKEKIDFIMDLVKEERGHISLTKPIIYDGNQLVVTGIFANGRLAYWYKQEGNYGTAGLGAVNNDVIMDEIVDCIKNNYYI